MLALLQIADAAAPWQWTAIAFWAVIELLVVIFVWRVVASGGAPSSTLLWIVVILVLPYGTGLLLYYLFPRRLQLRRLRQLRTSQQRWRAPSRAREGDGQPDLQDSGPLCRLLSGIAPDWLARGNRVSWLPSGNDFFHAAALAIEGSRAFVHFEVYIFRPDATGMRLLELLVAAARRGVQVRLLYDSFGSFGLKSRHLAALREAGGKAEPFMPLLWKRRPFTVNLRSHRKILVVDGEVAFTGGRNVGDEYANDRFGKKRKWLDAMVRVEGPAVSAMHELFAEDWFYATDEELTDARWYPPQPSKGHDVVGIVASGPDRDRQPLWLAAFQAIADARTSIDVSSPYLVPPPSLMLALFVAAARGVRVRVFTNGRRSEAIVLYHAQRSYYDELVENGIEVYETQADYNHAKALVVDGRVAMVGSANLDLRSAHLNFEVAAVLPDSPDFARAVLQTLDERAAECRRVASPAQKRAWMRLLDGFCRLLSPLL